MSKICKKKEKEKKKKRIPKRTRNKTWSRFLVSGVIGYCIALLSVLIVAGLSFNLKLILTKPEHCTLFFSFWVSFNPRVLIHHPLLHSLSMSSSTLVPSNTRFSRSVHCFTSPTLLGTQYSEAWLVLVTSPKPFTFLTLCSNMRSHLITTHTLLSSRHVLPCVCLS